MDEVCSNPSSDRIAKICARRNTDRPFDAAKEQAPSEPEKAAPVYDAHDE